jgi:hypothetical protein
LDGEYRCGWPIIGSMDATAENPLPPDPTAPFRDALNVGSYPGAGTLKLRMVGVEVCLLLLCGCDDHQGADGQGWHVSVFRALLREIVTSHEELESALVAKRIGRLAWAARQFMELRILALYVAGSTENAKRLWQDRYLDAADLLKRFTAISDATDALKPFAAQVDPARKKVESGLQECGFTGREGILRTSRIAEDLGLKAEFAAMNPLLSKLVHPTAYSLFAALQPEQEGLFCQLLFNIGAWYCDVALTILDARLKALGWPSLP